MKLQKIKEETFLQNYGSFLNDVVNRTMINKFNLDGGMTGYNDFLIVLSYLFIDTNTNVATKNLKDPLTPIKKMGSLLLDLDKSLFYDGEELFKATNVSKEDIIEIDLDLAVGCDFDSIKKEYDYKFEVAEKSEARGVNRPGFIIPNDVLDVDYESIYDEVYKLRDLMKVSIGDELELKFDLT